MSQTYYLRNTNADTTCDGASTPKDLSKTQGSPTTQATSTTSSASFVEVASFDINASGDGPASGNADVSVDVAIVNVGSEYRFRVQAVDDSGCGVTASSAYSAAFTTNGIKTLSTTLAWAAGDDRLRLSIEARLASGHGSAGITVNVNDTDSTVVMEFPAPPARIYEVV